MLHPVYRASRIGFALVLLPVFLGSASGAPAPGTAVPAERPLKSVPPVEVALDRPDFVEATIPCISGTCEVQVHAPALRAPIKPLSPRTTTR